MVRKELKGHRHAGPPGLAAELDMLSENMRLAFTDAEHAYSSFGVRYVVVGALAAGSYGEPRNTKDIDFLVGDEGFAKIGTIISFAKPFPLEARRVAIDTIPLPEHRGRWAVLNHALSHPFIDTSTGNPIPLLPPTALAYMKLASPRSKDRADIVSMLHAETIDVPLLTSLVADDDELRVRFEAAVLEAGLDE